MQSYFFDEVAEEARTSTLSMAARPDPSSLFRLRAKRVDALRRATGSEPSAPRRYMVPSFGSSEKETRPAAKEREPENLPV